MATFRFRFGRIGEVLLHGREIGIADDMDCEPVADPEDGTVQIAVAVLRVGGALVNKMDEILVALDSLKSDSD